MNARKILITLTARLVEVIDRSIVNDPRSRSEAIEDWLWQNPRIIDTAREAGIKRLQRKRRGRPPTSE